VGTSHRPVAGGTRPRVADLCVVRPGAAGPHLRWAGAPPAAAGLLGGLGWDERAAVVLHEFAGLSVPEIASLLGRPAGEVAHRLQTAEATLAGAGPRS